MQRDRAGGPPSAPTQVVLFTNGYPYDAGEEFLETEISYLSAAFARVLIVPLTNPSNASRMRAVPDNATVMRPKYEQQRGPHTLYAYASKHPFRALLSLCRALSGRNGFSSALEDFKFLLASELIADRTILQLREQLDTRTRAVFYAYWLHAPAQVALISRARLRMRSSPVVSRAHRYDLYAFPEENHVPPARRQLLRRLTRVFPVAEHGRAYLATHFPRYADRFSVERLGVQPAHHAGNPDLSPRTVYSCSSLLPVKRIPLLIEGIAAAQRRGLNLHWVHIGGGSSSTLEELMGLARDQLEPDSFEFTGSLSNEEVRTLYAERPGSALLNCSASEGVPVSMMEALAQGMPLIATDVGGSSELIAPGEGMFDGLLKENPSPEEIADRLEDLFSSSPTEYESFVRANLKHWRTDWSAENNYTAFCRLLSTL